MEAFLKSAAISAIVLVLTVSGAHAQDSRAPEYEFIVAAGPLGTALETVSQKSGTTILARSEIIEGLRVPELSGRFSVPEALGRLVDSAGLEVRAVGEAFVVEAPSVPPSPSSIANRPAPRMLALPVKLRNDTIVVTGFRTSNAAAIEDKFRSGAILDGVNQDTITLLPDLAVSDVARRIPGVASIPENGTETKRQIQTSQNVLIRGLDANYSQTTIDGLPFASASEDNRAANLSLFPPTAIARVEAVKTLSSDIDPHGLTGRLDLQTASALARGDAFNALRFSIGENSTAGRVLDEQGPNLRADALVQRILGDQVGVSFAASYEHFNSTSRDERPGGESGTYLFYSPDPAILSPVERYDDSDALPAPRRNQLYLFENEQERASALAKLEWGKAPDSWLVVTGGFFWQEEREVRHEHLVVSDDAPRPVDRTLENGTWGLGQVEAGYVAQPETSLTGLVSARASYPLSARRQLDFAVSLSSAEVDVTRHMSKFITGQSGTSLTWDLPFSYTVTPSGVTLDIFDPDRANDPSAYGSSYVRAWTEGIEQDLAYGEARYSLHENASRLGWSLETGLALTRKLQGFDREYIEGDVFDVIGCEAGDVRDCPYANFSAYVENRRFATTDPDVDFLLVNDKAVRAAWQAQGLPLTVDRTDSSINADYDLSESYVGVWSRLAFDNEAWRIEAGLRHDSAGAEADLYLRDRRLPSDPKSTQYLPSSRSYDYDFLLPSFLARAALREDLILRGAWGRTIGRPNILDLTRSDTIGVPNTSAEVVISRGNPDLRPLVSDNLDLSLEYYFDDRRSLASLALFQKNVKDLIFLRANLVENFELDGQALTATVLQPVNTSDASIYGIEAALRLDMAERAPEPWDGFVFDANLTWTGSEFTYFDTDGTPRSPGGWVNQPELIYNLQMSYEQGPFGGKIAYNFIDEYLSNVLADSGDLYDTYAAPRSVIDLQLRYAVTDNLVLLGEVQNLTKQNIEFNRRFPFGDLLATRAERGRVTWIGLSWTP